MNAREAMQALLDGKTVYHDNERIELRLDMGGTLLCRIDDKDWTTWGFVLNCCDGIVEEYPLTFEQALRAMLDGKICETISGVKFRFNHEYSLFETCHKPTQTWGACEIGFDEQKAKWQVVE